MKSTSAAVLFLRLRWALVRNSWRALVGRSKVRPITVLVCSLVIALFVFFVSWEGFRFLSQQGLELGGGIVGMLFDLMFLALAGLLVFSSGLILYSSLFNSQEAGFLLSSPATADQIFAFKFQGALAFSSWAFLLLGGPVLVAYGIVYRATPMFYGVLPLFFLGFILIPGSLGAIVCLLVVNFLPQRRKQVVILAVVLVGLLAVVWGYRMVHEARHGSQAFTRDAVQKLWGRLEIAQ